MPREKLTSSVLPIMTAIQVACLAIGLLLGGVATKAGGAFILLSFIAFGMGWYANDAKLRNDKKD